MKKVLSLALSALLIACLLTGCGCKHQWAEASCTAPKTCTLCGEIEGEPLPHNYSPATCASPSVCKDCGLRQGEALPHANVTEANYQDPAQCLDCGAVLGDPLTPIYEEKGISMNLQPGVPAPYVTTCWKDPEQATTGTAILTDCGVLDENAIAQWNEIFDFPLEAREGYEWIAARIEITFDDENAWNYGILTRALFENYYDPYLFDDSLVELGEQLYESTILWHGEKVQMRTAIVTKNGEWTPEKTILITKYFAFDVPVGYRGAVVGLINDKDAQDEGEYYVDDPVEGTLLYRIR